MEPVPDLGEGELDGPPRFVYGQKVRSRKSVRNDGTFPGREVGDILVKKGEIGYVTSIGTFLQRFYIYGVDFVERGYRVGMKSKELEVPRWRREPRRGRTIRQEPAL
jgi:nitrogen fixation protein NifZ